MMADDTSDEQLHPLLTVGGIQREFVRLAMATRPFANQDGLNFVTTVLSREQISAIAEYRKTLDRLLDLARDTKLEDLASLNEALNDELDRIEQAKQGHAVRADTASAPRPAPH
jgi:hypothetical protein